MKKLVVVIIILFPSVSTIVKGQGYNHQWLLGSYDFFPDPKGRILFDSSNYTLVNENRKMPFYGTQGNISDANGDLLMSSNGIWIANALGDTILDGAGLNPGTYANSWQFGMPLTYNNIFVPYPGDSNKIVLFHHSFNFDGNSYVANDMLYSIIDMTLDGGQGQVISKNNIAFSDTLNQGFAAVKHANGRDWWIISQKHNSDIVFIILFTVNGIETISSQPLGVPYARYNVTQLSFSQDGNKFAYFRYDPVSLDESIIISDFNRCTGIFSNSVVALITLCDYLWGLAFSSTSKYIYVCSSNLVYQFNIDSLSFDTVASYDGFLSPGPNCCATTFWNMYLAANGKIYITSGSSVQHLHEINFPDSAGVACDVQQHSISLGYAQLRAVPNHPNYYLGPVVGSVCDSLTGLNEHLNEIKNFSIRPNPNNGDFSITYLLPQGQPGWFEVYDVLGKQVFKMTLPSWSTLQSIQLPSVPTGIYNAVIRSGYDRVSKKIAVIKN